MSLEDDIRRAMKRGADEAIRLAAQLVLEQAQRNAPIGDPTVDPDPGVSLRDSGRIEKTATGYRVVFDTPYAAAQEFNMRLKHPRGGGARYLGRALATVIPKFDDLVATRVKAHITKGTISRRWDR